MVSILPLLAIYQWVVGCTRCLFFLTSVHQITIIMIITITIITISTCIFNIVIGWLDCDEYDSGDGQDHAWLSTLAGRWTS